MCKNLWNAFTKKERRVFLAAVVVCAGSAVTAGALAFNENSVFIPVAGGIYREGEVGQPVAINPITSANPVDLDVGALLYGKVGDILTSHEMSEKGLQHTIKIREGVRWSNGTPLTSNDIVFTVRAIEEPETRSPLFKKWAGVVVERVSELQVRFTLQTPYAFFPEAIKNLPIIPEHVFGKIPPANLKLSDYNLAPVGSGPYKVHTLEKRRDGFIKEIRLVRNEEYPLPSPFIDEFVFMFFETEEARASAFQKRQIDGMGVSNPGEARKKEVRGAEVTLFPFSRSYALFINEALNPLLKTRGFRQALRDSIDKEALLQTLFNEGLASPLEGPFAALPQSRNTPRMEQGEARALIASRKEAEGTLALNLIVPDVNFLKRT
ncbi:MAG: ABC transporter substrate-binding protein, partial [Patescibacteria group bacterium]